MSENDFRFDSLGQKVFVGDHVVYFLRSEVRYGKVTKLTDKGMTMTRRIGIDIDDKVNRPFRRVVKVDSSVIKKFEIKNKLKQINEN